MSWNANLFFAVRRNLVEVGNVLLLHEMAAEPAGIEHAALPSFCGSPCVAHAEAASAAQRLAECRGFRWWIQWSAWREQDPENGN